MRNVKDVNVFNSMRALAFHQCGPGSIPARYHVGVEFSPCSQGFSLGSPGFLPPLKSTVQIPIQPDGGSA